MLSVVVSVYMAYAFSKYRFRGRSQLMYFVLSSQMFPQALLLVTLYVVFAQFGLLNTYAALIVSFTTFTLPLCVWMLKGFFDALPDEPHRSRARSTAPGPVADTPLGDPAAGRSGPQWPPGCSRSSAAGTTSCSP